MKSFACSRRFQYINISMSESVKKKKCFLCLLGFKKNELLDPGQTLTVQGYTEHLAPQNDILEEEKKTFFWTNRFTSDFITGFKYDNKLS